MCSSNQKVGILCFGRQNEVSLADSVCDKNEPLITAYDGQKQTKLSTLTSNSIYNNSVNSQLFQISPKSQCQTQTETFTAGATSILHIHIVTLQMTEFNAAVDVWTLCMWN